MPNRKPISKRILCTHLQKSERISLFFFVLSLAIPYVEQVRVYCVMCVILGHMLRTDNNEQRQIFTHLSPFHCGIECTALASFSNNSNDGFRTIIRRLTKMYSVLTARILIKRSFPHGIADLLHFRITFARAYSNYRPDRNYILLWNNAKWTFTVSI